MTLNNWLMLACFAAVLLSASLQLLAASGHFPRDKRVAELQGTSGALILHSTMLVTVTAVILSIIIAGTGLPWYAAVIGGGVAALSAPLVLPNFSDDFVDGVRALLLFALCTLLALGAMWLLR